MKQVITINIYKTIIVYYGLLLEVILYYYRCNECKTGKKYVGLPLTLVCARIYNKKECFCVS